MIYRYSVVDKAKKLSHICMDQMMIKSQGSTCKSPNWAYANMAFFGYFPTLCSSKPLSALLLRKEGFPNPNSQARLHVQVWWWRWNPLIKKIRFFMIITLLWKQSQYFPYLYIGTAGMSGKVSKPASIQSISRNVLTHSSRQRSHMRYLSVRWTTSSYDL